jgi:hypothetical protein
LVAEELLEGLLPLRRAIQDNGYMFDRQISGNRSGVVL